MSRLIALGWAAPPIGKQVPELTADDAERIDGHRAAITRLYVHGFLTEAQRDKAYSKIRREVSELIAPPLSPEKTGGEE